jgi:hypothetical protein
MQALGPYSLCAVVQCPDGVVEVHAVTERVTKGRALRNGRGDCRLEEVHFCRIGVADLTGEVAGLLRADEQLP